MPRRWDISTGKLFDTLFPFIFLLYFAFGSDRDALLSFKRSVSDPAGLLLAWSEESLDHCSWPWLSCDSRSRVVAVNISTDSIDLCPLASPTFRRCSDSTRRLTGRLPVAIGELSQLRILYLPLHSFSGEIPDEIWLLENLEVLNLESNLLSGFLPPQFPRGLRSLNLAFNQIASEIPKALSDCLELETLDLSNNHFNGTIPGFLLNLPFLRDLSLSFNYLTGPIPDEFGLYCRNLQHLDLSGNLLLGRIPLSLAKCANLQTLMLFSNLLDDVIPPDLGLLSNLQVLDVSRNSLSGPVPSELGNCTALSVIVLSNPYHPVRLKEYNENDSDIDDFNCFQGGIPDAITSLPNLKVLWAPRIILEGEIPTNWGTCQSLQMINFGENLFTGKVPEAFNHCNNLKFLNLSSNKLSGHINEKLPVPCMNVFDASQNLLSGSIPAFVGTSCPSSRFSDNLSPDYTSFFSKRALVGLTPPYVNTASEQLVYHSFSGNNFSGNLPPLPVSAKAFSKQLFYAFSAERNKISGPLTDDFFEKCRDLNGLIANLSNNLIYGEFPADIGFFCEPLMVLDASKNQFTGTIPSSLGLLKRLIALDLSKNRLLGQIPLSLVNLKDLKYFSVAGNNLSGQIPSGLDHLSSLEIVDLSFNSLRGVIPSGLVKLKNLSVLLLDSNKLSGMIPKMSFVQTFNLSFNNLSGPLPFNSSEMRCESVYGNPLLPPCPLVSLSESPSARQGDPDDSQALSDTPPGSPPAKSGSGSGFSSIEIASITSASAIVSVLLALIVLYVYTTKCSPRSLQQPPGQAEVTVFSDIGVPITYESVVRATGGFNASNCIGSGGFGATYKAEISPGVLVAIKRLSIGRLQGVQQFHAEIKTLGRWRHSNLVTLIGYHLSDAEMFLIYNYLPGGNLERFIQERSKKPVSWRMLHKIALDVARALAYLHDNCVPRILHRDVKPSNILLDKDYNAYLSDFGLARLLGNSETHATTGVAGTFGYVAPEYAMTCRVSDKADVYSYGVVLLELVSDKKALDPSFSPYGNGFNIVAWACMLLRQGRAREFFIDGLWEVGPRDDLVETLHLAVSCTVESLSIRPSMKQVVQRLKQLQPPTL